MLAYGIVFAVAAVVTFALTPWVWRLSVRWGAVVKPDERRIHEHPTPTLGGVAMLLALLVALAVAW
ncbi:MAG: undecaprenyl/decaprenyl-phosphate alpha-N-acetylglucosaminyl 1-phosphate transferase, partial [Candidatus Limnocylindria bacterium]